MVTLWSEVKSFSGLPTITDMKRSFLLLVEFSPSLPLIVIRRDPVRDLKVVTYLALRVQMASSTSVPLDGIKIEESW
jgi:hypothetical protein